MRHLFLVPLFVAAAAPLLAAQQPAGEERPKITVTGETVVYATPDKIVLNFGIQTRDKELVVAKTKNAEIWKKAAAALKECGVPAKDIQTECLSINPIYKDGYAREIDGFFANTLFVVTLSDPAKVETLISKMFESGVNYMHGVDFETTKFKQHRESARELALTAAKEKAEKMAGALGGSIGRPLSIIESSSPTPWYFSSWHYWGYGGWGYGSYGRGGGMSQNVIQDTRGTGPESTGSMALGKILIRASVSVVFELK